MTINIIQTPPEGFGISLVGPQGPAGATWLTGSGIPAGILGFVNDLYLNTANGDVYKKTGSSTWTFQLSIIGPPGSGGGGGGTAAAWLSGSSAPATGTGNVGDWYLNTTTYDIYEKTGASTWTSRGNIKGATGANGTNGTNGTNGSDGAPGSAWYQNSTTPDSGGGLVGDWFVNTATSDVYQKTDSSTWTLRLNMKGPQGNTGATGSTGATGANGTNGLNGVPRPSEHGMMAWVSPPEACGNTAVAIAGTLFLSRFYVEQAFTPNTLYWHVSSAAVTPTSGQNFVGLFDSTGNLLGSAVGVDSDTSSQGTKATAISPGALTAGSYYWVAFLFNAATAPQLPRPAGASINGISTLLNVGLSATTYRFATNGTGRTSIPSTITPSSNAIASGFWAALK